MSNNTRLGVCVLFFCLSVVNFAYSNPTRIKRQWTWDEQTPRPQPTNPPNTSPTTTTASSSSSGLSRECLINCLRFTTNEYNPICGSDGVTYDNPSKLKCSTTCGATVTISFMGTCAPL